MSLVRARAALLLGGGEEVAGAYLGCNTTHVICNPETASRWLSMGALERIAVCCTAPYGDVRHAHWTSRAVDRSGKGGDILQGNEPMCPWPAQQGRAACRTMLSELPCAGVNVVSPQWVLRSAKQGSLQRVVAMSLDASRRLPADAAARHNRAAAVSTAEEARQSADGAAASAEAGTDRAEREAMLARLLLEQVQYGGSPHTRLSCVDGVSPLRASASQAPAIERQLTKVPAAVPLAQLPGESTVVAAGSSSVRGGPTPGCLLQDLLWSVTEPVGAARLDTRRTAVAGNASPRCLRPLNTQRHVCF